MCFSLQWLGSVLVWLVIIGACIAIIRLVLPLALNWLGSPGPVIVQILTIVLWAIVAIFVIWFAIDMISCLLGMAGGLHLPRHGG